MKKTYAVITAISIASVFYACKKNTTNSGNNNVSINPVLPAEPYVYFVSGSQQFQDSLNNRATLGRVLFYDNHLSVNNSVSCAGCHKQAYAFADNVAFSAGYEGHLTGRNSPPVMNLSPTSNFLLGGIKSGFSVNLFWDGRENNLNTLLLRPLTNHVEMGITDSISLCEKLSALPYYSSLFSKAYGTPEVTLSRISDAVGFFMAGIRSTNSRFDKSRKGMADLTALEAMGMNLFQSKYNCGKCHSVDTFGSYSGNPGGTAFIDIGLNSNYADKGRADISQNAGDEGKFKVPSLRNIALTAPYMHDGRFKTLDEVLNHYSKNIQNSANLDDRLKDTDGNPMRMQISDNDKQAIIAFLNTLTDYDMITDIKYSNPFQVQ